MSSDMKNRDGQGGAYMKLGELLSKEGDYANSTQHFYKAMKVAE